MSRVKSEALDNIQQFVAIQRDSELQVASAFLSPLSLSPLYLFLLLYVCPALLVEGNA